MSDDWGQDELFDGSETLGGVYQASPPHGEHSRRSSKSSRDFFGTIGQTSTTLQEQLRPMDHDGSPEAKEIGFLGYKSKKNDSACLREIAEEHNHFINLLSHLDSREAGPSRSRSNPLNHIEARLNRHLMLMREAERTREVQCHELEGLLRDMRSVSWPDEEDRHPSHPKSRKPVGLGISIDLAKEEPLGWTGDPVVASKSSDRPPRSPLSPISSNSAASRQEKDITHGKSVDDGVHRQKSPFGGTTEHGREASDNGSLLPLLPREMALFIQSAADCTQTLASLADDIHASASYSTGISRQLKGIRAGIDSWRERETQEETARSLIEMWERTQLERGLTGDGRRTKEKLDVELDEFRGKLEDWAGQVQKISAAVKHLDSAGQAVT